MPFLEEVSKHIAVEQRCKVRLVSLKKVGGKICVLEGSVLSVPDLEHVGANFINRGEIITLSSGCRLKGRLYGNFKLYEGPKIDYKKLSLITDNGAGIF